MLERSQAVAEPGLLGRVARLALEASQALVELGELRAIRDGGADVDGAGDRSRSVSAARGSRGRRCSRPAGPGSTRRRLGLLRGAMRCSMCWRRSSGVSAASGRAASEIRLRLEERAFASVEVALAAGELERVRGQSHERARAPDRRGLSSALRSGALGRCASASSRSRSSTAATARSARARRRPSSCSAAMRIARRRSCSDWMETGSSYCYRTAATHR